MTVLDFNIILAGVGGQGILTTAQAISIAALRRGWFVKQAELHGMAQRGGAVQSHLRISDHEIFSDIIPRGRADMILAMEPLEALRYVHYLAEGGLIVANTVPVVNIPNYGPVEDVLQRLSQYPRHVLFDANRLASAAGSSRSVNMVMLGAASAFLDIPINDVEAAITEMFASKESKLIEVNHKAFLHGLNAAKAYHKALRCGADSRSIRQWLGTLPVEELAEATQQDLSRTALALDHELSSAETTAIDRILRNLEDQNRSQLYEHEVYRMVELLGAISPPRHVFVPDGLSVTAELLARFHGDRVVLKLVSPDIVHKSDVGAVKFVENNPVIVAREVDRLIDRQRDRSDRIEGVLIVEFVDHEGLGFGRELFVGIRATREFGPVIAAGLGGVDTEYLATKLKPGIAVAKALAFDTSAKEFFELFKKTAAYDVLAGRARGHRRIVCDGELVRCFRAFIAIARQFCVHRDGAGPELCELEVNPFAFRRETMVPLDGRGRLGTATKPTIPRPLMKIDGLLEPKSIAILGVSGKRENFGRIILKNIKRCGFPTDHLYIVKDQIEPIEGVSCMPNGAALPEEVDLLVMAAATKDTPRFVSEVIASGKVHSVILIPGGMGETEDTETIPEELQQVIADARCKGNESPIFLGGNCLGVRSRPGRYDTFFIPDKKLNPMSDIETSRAAFIAQSGGFIITRLSNWESLNPAFSISIGNQVDLSVSDLLQRVAQRDDIDAIGVYMEGFRDLDGLEFVRAVRQATTAGKTVVFYKAGKTEAGRSATAGHTASIAGDYDVCQAAAAQAGAIVTETFKEFEQVMELATRLHDKQVAGRRLGVVSNAGFETVGMADAIAGPRYQVEIAKLSDTTLDKLDREFKRNRLETLVNPRNPLDLTPMAGDAAYEQSARIMLQDENVDAVVVALVPMTPGMRTTPDEISDADSIAKRLPALFHESNKPLAVVIDCGPPYDVLVRAMRTAGLPVFPSSDQAVRSIGRYLCHRADHNLSKSIDETHVDESPQSAEQNAKFVSI